MTKEFIENAEMQSSMNYGYIIRCDSKQNPLKSSDEYFNLWEFDRLKDAIALLERNSIKYDLAFTSFDKINDNIDCEALIVGNNSDNY